MKKEKIQKKYYSIGEIAKMLKVAPSLIRFWESRFSSINPRKSKNGVRQYTVADIEKLKMVYYLVKERGYTLQGAEEILTKKEDKVQDTVKLLEEMQALRKFLMDLKNNLSTSPASKPSTDDLEK